MDTVECTNCKIKGPLPLVFMCEMCINLLKDIIPDDETGEIIVLKKGQLAKRGVKSIKK